MPRMDDNKLKAICDAKLNNALGWLGGRLSKDRQLAMSYYRGDLFGNEQDGRSKVVSRDVAEAIDSVMPSLVKVFATTDTMIVCQPQTPQDEQAAKQATDYLNWVFQSQPNAFDLLQTWIKDALLSKLGVVKSWWDETVEVVTEEYEGLTYFQYLSLIADENVEVESVTTQPLTPIMTPDLIAAQLQQPQGMQAGPAPAQPMPPGLFAPELAYECTIKRTNRRGHVCIEAIPPEEFLTDRRAISLESATFCAHRSKKTVSELIAMGFPKKQVHDLPGGDDLDFNAEVLTRFEAEDEMPTREDTDSLDESMRSVWVAECYLKVDYDGNGIAEWRKVILAGGSGMEILEQEPCEGHPFSAWTPNKMPHKLYGESLADKTMDIQLIKSTVWRQNLDGMYFNNAPQLVVVEGQANMDDVLTRRPGGVIRARQIGAVQPLPVQDVSGPAFAMINYLDSVREARTGMRRFAPASDSDALNPYAQTATGAKLVEDGSQDRTMLLARNFGEQGLKPLFQRLLELICKHQDKPMTVRLRNQWVDIDPSTWSTKMDMTVQVGLGTGNRETQVGQLMTMLTQIDAPIIQLQGGLEGPLLTAAHVYNKLSKLTEAMGYRNVEGFYADPASAPPMQKKPPEQDPAMQEAMAMIEVEKFKAQARAKQSTQDAADKQSLAVMQANFDMKLATYKAESEVAIAQYEAALKANQAQRALEAKAKVDAVSKLIDALITHHTQQPAQTAQQMQTAPTVQTLQ